MKNIFLKSLYLENFGTIKSQKIDFSKGLNFICGETGSGKTLLFSAIKILSGSQAEKKWIQKGRDYSLVEGVVVIDSKILRIKRIISRQSASDIFINEKKTSLGELKAVLSPCFDFSNQFEHREFLSSEYQMALIDSIAQCKDDVEKLKSHQEKFEKLLRKKHELETELKNKKEILENIQPKINEIQKINLKEGEEEKLDQILDMIANSERVECTRQRSLHLIEDDERGFIDLLSKMIHDFAKDEHVFTKAHSKALQALDSFYELRDLLSSKNDDFDYSLEEAKSRYQKIDSLKNKFSLFKQSLNSFYNELVMKKERFFVLDREIVDVNSSIADQQASIDRIFKNIEKKRKSAILKIQKDIPHLLEPLFNNKVKLNILLKPLQTHNAAKIHHSVDILIETNIGHGFHLLSEIASGGELSRLYLAFRTLLLELYPRIRLYDEIESGLGGESAYRLGEFLKKSSQNNQTITISHLPQVAIHGERIIQVEKISHFKQVETITKVIKASQRDSFLKNMTSLKDLISDRNESIA